jgi:hypothetical protein
MRQDMKDVLAIIATLDDHWQNYAVRTLQCIVRAEEEDRTMTPAEITKLRTLERAEFERVQADLRALIDKLRKERKRRARE